MLGRREQQLLDEQARHLVDARARLRRQAAELGLEPRELGLADAFEALPQRHDRRHDLARLQPRRKARDFLVDDRLGARELGAPPRQVLADDRLQIVHVVEEDLIQIADRGLDIARQGDVDDEERPVPPRAHRLLDRRSRQHGFGRAGGGDDDVGGDERRRAAPATARRGPRAGAPGARPTASVRLAMVICLHALRAQVDARELGHLAGAEDEHAQAGEVAEDLLGELDGGVAHRHGAFGEPGFAADALADRERGVEQPMRDGAGEVEVARRRVRRLHLAEDLRLADDERVEARRRRGRDGGRRRRRDGSRGARSARAGSRPW